MESYQQTVKTKVICLFWKQRSIDKLNVNQMTDILWAV